MDVCREQRVLRSNTTHEPNLDGDYCVVNSSPFEQRSYHQSTQIDECVGGYDASQVDSESESSEVRGAQEASGQPAELQGLRAQDAIRRGKRRKNLPAPPRWYAEYIQRFQFDPIEWKSPKYRQYREKQKTPKEKERKGPWNDDIEYAFQKALRLHGGRGRAKDDLGGKLCGGNEWIAWCIWVQTGVALDRKQVSSHLQVLKVKMKDNVPWLDIATEVQREEDKINRRRHKHLAQSRTQQPGKAIQGVFIGGTLPSNEPQRPVIHSVDFGMYMRSKIEDKSHVSRPTTHHTYTQIEYERASAPKEFTDLSLWQQRFKRMSLWDEFESRIPTYLFDVGICLKDDIIAHTRLEITLDLNINNGAGYSKWVTRTQLCDETGLYDVGSEPVRMTKTENNLLELRPMNMGASFWMKLFVNFSRQKSNAKRSGDSIRLHQEDCIAQSFLSNVRMFQQLCATPATGTGRPVCVANLLWQYHLVAADTVPTTSYRPLSSPAPQQLLPSRTTELNEWMASEFADSDQLQLQNQFSHQEPVDTNIFDTDNYGMAGQQGLLATVQPLASTESSPVTELTTDAGSSLSSASISLVPSISNSSSLPSSNPYNLIDPYTFDEAYSSFDSGSNQMPVEPATAQSKFTESYEGPVPIPVGTDYAVNDSVLSQDQYDDICAHFPDFSFCLPQGGAVAGDEKSNSGNAPFSSKVVTPRESQGTSHEGSADINQRQETQQWQAHSLPIECNSPLVAPRAQPIQHRNHILQLQHFDFLAQEMQEPVDGIHTMTSQRAEPGIIPKDAVLGQQPSKTSVEHQHSRSQTSPRHDVVEGLRLGDDPDTAAADQVPVCVPPFMNSVVGDVFDVDWHLIDSEKQLEEIAGRQFNPGTT